MPPLPTPSAPRTAKLKVKLEDYRLRNKPVGYLQCGNYRNTDSEGYHLVEVTCRPCGKRWLERARRLWKGHVTQCGCQGSDLQTIRMWLHITRDKTRPTHASEQQTALLNEWVRIPDHCLLDNPPEPDYPDHWLMYWRFRADVGLAPSEEHVLDVVMGRWSWVKREDALHQWVDMSRVIDLPDGGLDAWLESI